jgi:hypothetical protein
MRLLEGLVIAVLALLVESVIAQEQDPQAQNRLITIEWSGGTQRSPDLRYGPIEFSHRQPGGIIGAVANLTISSQKANLVAPDSTLIAESQGKRTVTFEVGVKVMRGRLEATGLRLEYSEASGFGVLSSDAYVVINPRQEGEDKVTISAAVVAFDVDTDRSFSSGGIELVSGNQTANAQELAFAEDQGLGWLTGTPQPKIHRVADDGDEFFIIADEIRVLTHLKRLHAIGRVTVVDGSIATYGEEAFFDDFLQIVEVVGSPAVSVDEANGVELQADRIRQDIKFDFVEQILATGPSLFDPKLFFFEEESRVIGEEASPVEARPGYGEPGGEGSAGY